MYISLIIFLWIDKVELIRFGTGFVNNHSVVESVECYRTQSEIILDFLHVNLRFSKMSETPPKKNPEKILQMGYIRSERGKKP